MCAALTPAQFVANWARHPAPNAPITSCSWDAMNSYTHTGMLQIQRWNTADGIDPNFQAEEIIQAMHFAGAFILLSGSGIASLNGEEALAQRILEKCKEWAATGGADVS